MSADKKCLKCNKKQNFCNFRGERSTCKKCERIIAKTNYYKRLNKKRYIVFLHLISNPCKCGIKNPVCLECHHKNPRNKVDTISRMIADWRYSIQDLRNELRKCVVMCGSCHAKLEAKKSKHWHQNE